MERYRKKDVISDKELGGFEHIEINKIKTSINNIGTSKINLRKYIPTTLSVSLISVLIIIITLVISNNDLTTEIDFNTDGNFLSDTDGSGANASYVDMYPSFQDMLDGEWAKFYYGEVVRIEERNIMVDTMYFEVFESEDGKVLGEINVSVPRGQTRLKIGNIAVLYLDYDEEYSYYSPASPYKGTFMISGDEVYYSKELQELYNEIGNSKEEFFNIIFE